MMRSNPLTAMQKTYDDCFIVCSTAVYFESQNNEAEALRSWKNALDQLYYHNAYRVPSSFRPRTETERALQESIKQMELQCKERVDLLEALKRSREEPPQDNESTIGNGPTPLASPRSFSGVSGSESWIGGGSIPPISYPDIARPPTLPQRPAPPMQRSSQAAFVRPHLKSSSRQNSEASLHTMSPPPAQLPVPEKRRTSRTPSPEKKGGMLKTLRPQRKSQGGSSSSSNAKAVQSKSYRSQPAAAGAATQAWSSLRQDSDQYSRESVNAARNSIGSMQNLRITSPQEAPRASTSGRGSNDYTDGEPAARRSFDTPRTASDPRGRQLRPPQQPYSNLGRVGAIKSSENLGSSGGLQKTASAPEPPYPTYNEPPKKAALDPPVMAYRKEYGNNSNQIDSQAAVEMARRLHGRPTAQQDLYDDSPPESANHHIHRKALKSPPLPPPKSAGHRHNISSSDEMTGSSVDLAPAKVRAVRPPVPSSSSRRQQDSANNTATSQRPLTPTSDETSSPEALDDPDTIWRARTAKLLKNLPRGVDEGAAKQILNEIVIKGDEVHWSDVAGLDVAKTALKENVVYPFLRPDLFSGLREPARGMLLFGPPGTGKTMLARAVATESRSTFFAISASSLTSKFLGESEKLVRALFVLAKELAPSIIFVDEIDSLLSSRSDSGEHEATRRIKTEFLIQWSDLARAAAGSAASTASGDATRVLVLAATNLPWAIDEAARRRFVRRQYIPLPEDHVRGSQIVTLLSHQKHGLGEDDIDRLVRLTKGFSGSDITALAKDAAMGPLRSLGEMLLHTRMDAIRPIMMQDFEASLMTIRPSVSKQGLKQFEDWAAEYGERGG